MKKTECNLDTSSVTKKVLSEHNIIDPRSYCYNILPTQNELCRPKSCPITTIWKKETPQTTEAQSKTFLIPMKHNLKKCQESFVSRKVLEPPPAIQTSSKARAVSSVKKLLPPISIMETSTSTMESRRNIPVLSQAPSELGSTKLQKDGKNLVAGRDDAASSKMIDMKGTKMNDKGSVRGSTVQSETASVIIPGSIMDPIGIVGPSQVSKASSKSRKGGSNLSKLLGDSEGAGSLLASFGDAGLMKESLASSGAVSTAGAIMCECCRCSPCLCGPRGVNTENLFEAMKQLMGNSEDMDKLVGALGPGAIDAMQTILYSAGEEASKWATGAGMGVGRAGVGPKGMESSEDTATKRLSVLKSAVELLRGTGPQVESESQAAIREAWMAGQFDEMTSCHCLPGMCPCPGGHYIFKRKSSKKTDQQKKKIGKKEKKKGRKGGKKEKGPGKGGSSGESDRASRLSGTCICPTKHFLTPASSESEVSERFLRTGKKTYWDDLMICTCPSLQRTLVILKPEAVQFKDVVLRALKRQGMDILNERLVHLSPEEASELYEKHYGKPSFPHMIVSISQAPILVFSVGGINVVKDWNLLIGPNGMLPAEWFLPQWIGRKYGFRGGMKNVLKGSKNTVEAREENRYFFHDVIIDPVIKNEKDVKDYIGNYVNPTLLKGLAVLAKLKPIDPIMFLAEWLVTHNPYMPYFPTNVCLATS